MTAVKGFNEISYDELMDVNGGFDLIDFAGAVIVGAEVMKYVDRTWELCL